MDRIPIRKTDNRTAVIAKDTMILDVPVVREKEYDYDEYDGVVDDCEAVITC